MRKTVAAFRMNAEALWQPGFRVYFWTFTFYTVHPDWEAMWLFRKFLKHLSKVLGGDYSGVRVAEIHPGGHGVHFHALINRRLDVHIVRRIAKCFGIGRIFVEVADQNPEGCSSYLAKYLSKDKLGPKCKSGRMAPRWSCFGLLRKLKRTTKVCNLENCSPLWVFRRKYNLPFLGYRFEHLLSRCWLYGEESFKSAWYAAKRGELGTVLGVAMGQIRVTGPGVFVQRVDWFVAAQPF